MSLQKYFDHYESAHQNRWNRFFHYLGIPSILISLALILATPYARFGWALFILGWVFQFVGHAIEGTIPEFLKNPVYLLIGPLYFIYKIRGSIKETRNG